MKFSKLNFRDFDFEFFEDLSLENPQMVSEVDSLLEKRKKLNIPMVVRRANFELKEGKLAGIALIDSYINLWFRLNGDVKANEENTNITITITRAKLGIFSIKSTVLNLVKNLKLSNVTVSGNKIIVDLSSIILGRGGNGQQALK